MRKEHYWTGKDFDSRNYDIKTGYECKDTYCKLCGLPYSRISNEIHSMFDDICKNKIEEATTKEFIFSFSDGERLSFTNDSMLLNENYVLKKVSEKIKSIIMPKYEICNGYKKIIETSDKDFVNFLVEHSYKIKEIISAGRSQSESSGGFEGKPIIRHGFFSSKVIGVKQEGYHHSESQRHDVPIYIMELK